MGLADARAKTLTGLAADHHDLPRLCIAVRRRANGGGENLMQGVLIDSAGRETTYRMPPEHQLIERFKTVAHHLFPFGCGSLRTAPDCSCNLLRLLKAAFISSLHERIFKVGATVEKKPEDSA
jgi:hypothetical protein